MKPKGDTYDDTYDMELPTLFSFVSSSKFSTMKTCVVTGLSLVVELRQDQLSQSSRLNLDIVVGRTQNSGIQSGKKNESRYELADLVP